ncbi:MAG TPA: ROK family transcriptional regulator [Anaerolineaceae bacterium]
MTSPKATRELTKNHNRDLVLKLIIDNYSTSRADIARETKLTRTTVSDVVSGLIAEGLVQEIGLGESKGGKPSILISLVPNSRYLIGINLTQDKFIGSIVNLRGEIKKTVEVPVTTSDRDQALDLLYHILDELLASEWKPVIGIGVGTPGLINTRDGILINAVNLDWHDLPLARLISQRCSLPVSLLNDSQAAAIGEFVYGEHTGSSNLIVVTVQHGVGAGILVNGQIFQGDGGGAGEIGHIVMQKDGELCRCGRRGCLETVASARAVTQHVQERAHLSEPVSFDGVERAFRSGDAVVCEVVLEAGMYLGRALGSLVGALNIETIILTGDMTHFGAEWLAAVRQSMQETALERMTQQTRVEFGRLDYRATILGASAHLLLDNYALLFRQTENSPRPTYAPLTAPRSLA